MIIVKITVLLIVITIIFRLFVNSYLRQNPLEALKVSFNKNYTPWYTIIGGMLVLITIIGIIASLVWLLFLR